MSKINPDLQKERDQGTFNQEKLTYQLDGSDGITERRRYIEKMALNEAEFTKGPDYNFMSRSEKYSDAVRKAVHYIKCCEKFNLDNTADKYWFGNKSKLPLGAPGINDYLRECFFPNMPSPLNLHDDMFIPTLERMATKEQQQKWLPSARKYDIFGTYAQTELGHGTFVRGLETTATYDPNTQEFDLHSPTLTSTKWWPGGLGKTSNYAVVMALLYSGGKNMGMHPFMVQLRDIDTHEPLPGITVGDIGPKLGYDTIDNGFLRFDHVRIPRENMLMKNSEVLRDGTYVKTAKNEKLSYGTMVFVRAMIIHGVAAQGLAQACTIAIRYSAVRRQSEMKPGQPEPQILDYQTQQHKLLPLLASAYAIWFTGLHMREMYFQINYEIQQGNVEMLPELHGLSSGVKAFATDQAMWGIERCRLACGGHGYSHASGIPKIYGTAVPACTYEGENTVMLLQCARYLIKAYQTVKQGEELTGSADYLSEKRSPRSTIGADFSLESLLDAYKHRAARMIAEAAERISRVQAQGKDQYDAWNLSSVVLAGAAQAHCHYYLVKTFMSSIDRADGQDIADVLTQLCQLYATHGIVENAAGFLEDGYLSGDQLDLVRDKELSLLTDIRPNAVRLVDSFDFRDEMLCSILGRFDGNVYDNLYKWAASSPLNTEEVKDAFRKQLQPLMKGNTQAKL